jgi:hypothetical protein
MCHGPMEGAKQSELLYVIKYYFVKKKQKSFFFCSNVSSFITLYVARKTTWYHNTALKSYLKSIKSSYWNDQYTSVYVLSTFKIVRTKVIN